MTDSRQVRRATERHEAKVARAEAAGRKYPEAKYRPDHVSGKRYEANGKQECARRAAS
jgi:hypothetical protein